MGDFLIENLYITDFFARSNGVSPPQKQPTAPPQAPCAQLPACVRKDVPIAPFTTLRVGGPADYFAEPGSWEELVSLLAWARQRQLPVAVVGGGSNVLVHDRGVRGLVVRLVPPRRAPAVQRLPGAKVLLHGAALWSDVAETLAQDNLYGAEALTGIPGTVGAAAAQNIGAYGQDISETLLAVDAIVKNTGHSLRLAHSDLHFGYRYSHLRAGDGLWSGQYIVTAVHLQLHRKRQGPITFNALTEALAARNLDANAATAQQIGDAVWQLRQSRGMVWAGAHAPWGTVGSFFKNPVVSSAQLSCLQKTFSQVPHHAAPWGHKVPAAWLIEAAGFKKGWRYAEAQGRVGLSDLHALALCNLDGASAVEIVAAATILYEAVRTRCGVSLVAETQTLGFDAPKAPFY